MVPDNFPTHSDKSRLQPATNFDGDFDHRRLPNRLTP
jgi:hypothetical protein